MIEHLPRATWADLATKDELGEALNRGMGQLRAEMGQLRADMTRMEERLSDRFEKTLAEKLNAQTRALVTVTAGLLLSVASIAFAAFKLA